MPVEIAAQFVFSIMPDQEINFVCPLAELTNGGRELWIVGFVVEFVQAS